jgi:hypothetical protein
MTDTPKQAMLVALADAVATAITGAGLLPAGATVAREYAPIVDYEKVGDSLLVYVLPVDDPETRIGGGPVPIFDGRYTLKLATYQKIGVGTGAKAAADATLVVRQAIRDLFKRTLVVVNGTQKAQAVLQEIQHHGEGAYNPTILADMGVMVTAQWLLFRIGV